MKAQTIITLTEDMSEKKLKAFREVLNSPTLLERSKIALKEVVADTFDGSTETIEVDFKEVEE